MVMAVLAGRIGTLYLLVVVDVRGIPPDGMLWADAGGWIVEDIIVGVM